MIFTVAHAQEGGFDLFGFLILMAPMLLIWYFLLIRPQQRRMQEFQEMISSVRRGDEVVTGGGIVAKITRVKEGEDEVEAEIADGVKVRLMKSTIAMVNSKTAPADAAAPAKPANSDRKTASKK